LPSGADIKLDGRTSFLLVGNKGTRKTGFIGTCPTPAYVFDLDNGMAVHHGRADIHFDTFKEIARCRAGTDGKKKEDLLQLTDWQRKEGWYEWGQSYPAILDKLNAIGRSMDAGTCPYQTIAFDSLTTLTEVALSYILKGHATSDNPSGEFKDGRQMWLPFLTNMSELFGQFSAWPVVKVLTAHVRKDENLLDGSTERLPLVPGQFSGKVGIYFDEVYYTDVKVEPVKVAGKPDQKKETFFFRCHQDGIIKMAASRKLNLPDGLPTDYREIMKYVNSRPKAP
jgi:hypothetical protein